ncbi:cuticle protein 14-like [Tropilaelaps mercedesae]|uniref:Cuticle protein 14-like n=1 Tax=Tropilaelaps mercedesae TaxID=418985 RepID=A0A1V9X5T7_9ACAR|nr:cuticle protein 14-like [Tropilaelaps mercedesae]
MRTFIVLVVVFSVTSAALSDFEGVPGGSLLTSRIEDGRGNYKFGYNEKHATGGSFRSETGSAYGGVKGSYGLVDADGRQRIVSYVADADGFRASIKTNEPGTAPHSAAAALASDNLLAGGDIGKNVVIHGAVRGYPYPALAADHNEAPLAFSTRIWHAAPTAPRVTAVPASRANLRLISTPPFPRVLREVTPVSNYAGSDSPVYSNVAQPGPVPYTSQVTHSATPAVLAPAAPIAPTALPPTPKRISYSSQLAHFPGQIGTPVSYTSRVIHISTPALKPAPISAPISYTPTFKHVTPLIPDHARISGPLTYRSSLGYGRDVSYA